MPSQLARPPSALEYAPLASVGPQEAVPKAEERKREPQPEPEAARADTTNVVPMRLYGKCFSGGVEARGRARVNLNNDREIPEYVGR